MAAKKKKRSPTRCVICRTEPRFTGELCDLCDASYEEWLTKKRGSSLRWAAERVRDLVVLEALSAIERLS